VRIDFVGTQRISDPELDEVLADPAMMGVVRFDAWLPHATALQRLADSDALLILQPDLRLAIPAKLYEYAAVGRPILALADTDGAVARIIADEGWGRTVSNDDVEAIVSAMDDLLHARDRFVPVEPERLSNYRMDVLAGRLADVFHQASRPGLGPMVVTG
jgi:glycosyltransferase involved in cell wall biosynthesis